MQQIFAQMTSGPYKTLSALENVASFLSSLICALISSERKMKSQNQFFSSCLDHFKSHLFTVWRKSRRRSYLFIRSILSARKCGGDDRRCNLILIYLLEIVMTTKNLSSLQSIDDGRRLRLFHELCRIPLFPHHSLH